MLGIFNVIKKYCIAPFLLNNRNYRFILQWHTGSIVELLSFIYFVPSSLVKAEIGRGDSASLVSVFSALNLSSVLNS